MKLTIHLEPVELNSVTDCVRYAFKSSIDDGTGSGQCDLLPLVFPIAWYALWAVAFPVALFAYGWGAAWATIAAAGAASFYLLRR